MAATPHSTPRLVRACKGELLDRPPVWLMRQAGRYMPEYRAIREKVSFLELCKSPDLAAEVSLQPYHTFGMDGVIMFSDILIPPEAMGMEVIFGDGGPTFSSPIRSAADIDRLIIPDPLEKTGFVMEILRKLRAALVNDPDTALIGFAGAPWTLATYMIEGGASKHFARIKGMMHEQPEALHHLLNKLSQTVTLYLNAQIEAGAQVVQLFDTWAGILSEAEYREFVLPYHQQIIEGLHRDQASVSTPHQASGLSGAPVILYVNNSRGLLPLLAEAGPDVVGVDHLTSLADARKLVGSSFALQGNLDPVALFSPPEVLLPQVDAVLKAGGKQGFVFNLGHGILPATPVDNVRLLVNQVKASAVALQNSAPDAAVCTSAPS